MTKIPTIAQNPNGLHQRYAVTKLNGEPEDPNAVYIVLRVDHRGDDKAWTDACRYAVSCLALRLSETHPQLRSDLNDLLIDLVLEKANAQDPREQNSTQRPSQEGQAP